jgi:predicted AAA+ superfamily ATPase
MVGEFWIERTLGPLLSDPLGILKSFPVILLTGPRQVGKSSLLKRIGPNFQYISLDDLSVRLRANENPELFIRELRPPLIIDEIQYAPQLLSYIKIMVDQGLPPMSIFLTGSQNFKVMKGIQESLAGRVAILNLFGLSDAEKKIEIQSPIDYFEQIFISNFPKLNRCQNLDERALYLSSYLQTYVERDVSELLGVQKRREFEIFLKLCAMRTGQIINYQDLARDANVSPSVAKDWISVLEDSFLIKIIHPHFSNKSKRLIKSPKMYFMDAGLAAYLSGWKTAEQLYLGPQNGAFFETHQLINLVKNYRHQCKEVEISFWRTKDGQEVDFIVETSKSIFPVEVKMGIPRASEIIDFDRISGPNWEEGKIISLSFQEQASNVAKSAQPNPKTYLKDHWQLISPMDIFKIDF